jgi:glycosyltransferase involved in cell wall biosynthesis
MNYIRSRPEPTPRVSIGVPVYNGARYLAVALDALLAQTYEDFEIVICDNASTDATEEISREYAARDGRVRYHRNPGNIGAARNFVRVFELARGEYFRWASADDLSGPEFLERCVAVLDQHADVVQAYPRTMLIDADGTAYQEYDDNLHVVDERPSDRYIRVTRQLGLCNAIYGLMRADALRLTAVHGAYIGSDIPLQAEVALYGKIWEVPEPLFYRRMHPEAQSAMTEGDQLRHYRPDRLTELSLRNWRHFWERLASVRRAPIPLPEKVRLVRFLVRGMIGDREAYGAELVTAARFLAALAASRVRRHHFGWLPLLLLVVGG